MPLKRLQRLLGHSLWQTCSGLICIDVCSEPIYVMDLADNLQSQTYLGSTRGPVVWPADLQGPPASISGTLPRRSCMLRCAGPVARARQPVSGT